MCKTDNLETEQQLLWYLEGMRKQTKKKSKFHILETPLEDKLYYQAQTGWLDDKQIKRFLTDNNNNTY